MYRHFELTKGIGTLRGGGGAGSPTTKKDKGHFAIFPAAWLLSSFLFPALFEDILLTKSGKNFKEEQKDKNHDLFCFSFDTFLTKFGTKTSILKVF